MPKITRRQFMKKAVITGAALSTSPMIFIPRARAAWEPRTTVHPNIDNLRVAGITDSAMTSEEKPNTYWENQDRIVVKEKVWENMDKLASALANTSRPQEAWQAIFIKPPRKSWPDTVVAIKTNNISQQHTRSAVMAKVCQTLNSLGVKPSNIHIYDGVHGGNMRRDTPFKGLPKGTKIENKWGGPSTAISIPEPWKDGKGETKCVRHLADETVDILVNISMCKGHSGRFGGFTMTMKNHLGTFSPMHAHFFGSQDYLMAINKTTEILGPIDKRTGKVLYPRQQLCIVDALWASNDGPGGNPSAQPNFIAMGAFAPIVDYQVATRFRGERMGWEPNMKATRRMLEDFGYKADDLPAGGGIIEA